MWCTERENCPLKSVIIQILSDSLNAQNFPGSYYYFLVALISYSAHLGSKNEVQTEKLRSISVLSCVCLSGEHITGQATDHLQAKRGEAEES